MTMTWMQRCARAAGIVLIPLALGARPASAQYFGQNQVQYMTFDFKVLRTEHFDIYFYEHERAAAMQAARMAERWLTRLEDVLQDSLRGRQPLILYAAASQFRQTNTVAGIGEGTGGVTESFKRRIVLPFGVSLDETDHVIGHELVHAFQYDILGRTPSGVSGATSMPLWFIEGMAEYLSIGPVDAHTVMWIRDAIQRNDMPTIAQLENPKYFPYRFGQAFWAYIGARFGDDAYAFEELCAELGSAFLCASIGIENAPLQDHASYLDHWLKILKADKRAIFTAASQAQKAADYCLERGQHAKLAA